MSNIFTLIYERRAIKEFEKSSEPNKFSYLLSLACHYHMTAAAANLDVTSRNATLTISQTFACPPANPREHSCTRMDRIVRTRCRR